MRKALIGFLVLAAVGGAYYLGTHSNATPPVAAAPETAAKPSVIEDGLVVPTGLTMPATMPAMKIDEPTKVLTGEVKVPNDLLRSEPPPRHPALIIPSIPTEKK
ncbi:hypothetical protein [Limnoglobus roseus]|uniref:Uncharacterized protein n=1 Tax=Limnoglobus roseus TaxID=2598579 RepID=A0A5C1A5I1_9BACT|nr:hypothetical protein [Limnoglobus roseus]QEL13585.1 hypothetical protein PX52LOC_00443 [Limnoglobus roseus]